MLRPLEFVHFDHVKHVIVIEIEKEACLTGTRSNALKGRSISAQGKAQRAAALGTGYKYTAALKGQGNMVFQNKLCNGLLKTYQQTVFNINIIQI